VEAELLDEKEVMSLKPEPIGPVSSETARLAKLVFPDGCRWMKMRDELGTLYQDDLFAALFPKEGQPAHIVIPFADSLHIGGSQAAMYLAVAGTSLKNLRLPASNE
jgi:hypothetical protein